MPRIAESELERLKQTISLQRLAEARGVELKRHGADLIGRCPFHDDKTPSLVITPAKKPVALPGEVQRRRHRDRLGDESGGRVVPTCR